ncbi:MAG: UDP-2,3-diacylglucosamine diphosphatase [Rhodobacteraceae bacterium]|nr:UDP-2,3-diacylglucosamine diphosphatase [Paracoccaceae bacterium]
MGQPASLGSFVKHHRTLFLSDLHLGALGCRSDLILAFLAENRADTYVLVGDILDLWQPMLPHWTARDQAVVDHLAARQADGARLIYLRGNHDPAPETAPEKYRVPVTPCDEIIHETASGRRFLVLHGDSCDVRAVRAHMMTRLGSRIDHMLRVLDRNLWRLRRQSRPEARSTIEALLSSVNTLLHLRRGHERRLIALARAKNLDGVICGHFHIADLHDDHGLIYANCGDWVDSFTALGETADGHLQMLGGRGVVEQDRQAEPEFGQINA